MEVVLSVMSGLLMSAGRRFRLPARPVLVVGVFLHVERPQSFRLVDERSLLTFGQLLPLCAQALADLRVVHLGVLLGHLSPLAARPDHERVHRPLHMVVDRAAAAHFEAADHRHET